MKKYLSLLCLLLWWSVVHAQEPALLQTQIDQLLARLQHPLAAVRAQARHKLSCLGTAILPCLQKQLAQNPEGTRRELVKVLAHIPGPATVALLLELLADKDASVRLYVAKELLQKGPAVEQLLLRRLQTPFFQKEPFKRTTQIILTTLQYKKVEQELARLVPPSGSLGFYNGQFDRLLKMGPGIIAVLADIFCLRSPGEPPYEYVVTTIPKMKHESIKVLAGDALGECRELMQQVTPTLRRKVILILRTVSNCSSNQQLRETANVALYRLGKEGYVSNILRSYQSKLRRYPYDLDTRFKLAMLYLKIRDNRKGLRELEWIRDSRIPFANMQLLYYNLACTYALYKRVNKALDSLEKAVQYGYEDVAWMELDGDLANIRFHPRYQAIIKRLRKKQKRG